MLQGPGASTGFWQSSHLCMCNPGGLSPSWCVPSKIQLEGDSANLFGLFAKHLTEYLKKGGFPRMLTPLAHLAPLAFAWHENSPFCFPPGNAHSWTSTSSSWTKFMPGTAEFLLRRNTIWACSTPCERSSSYLRENRKPPGFLEHRPGWLGAGKPPARLGAGLESLYLLWFQSKPWFLILL